MRVGVEITGVDRTRAELAMVAKIAFTPAKWRQLFRKSGKPILEKAKSNVMGSDRADKSTLRRALKSKDPKYKKAAMIKIGYDQKLLPTISSKGRPYTAHGRTGVPIAQYQELGTKERTKKGGARTGRIKAGWEIYSAFATRKGQTILLSEQLVNQRLKEVTGKTFNLRFT